MLLVGWHAFAPGHQGDSERTRRERERPGGGQKEAGMRRGGGQKEGRRRPGRGQEEGPQRPSPKVLTLNVMIITAIPSHPIPFHTIQLN